LFGCLPSAKLISSIIKRGAAMAARKRKEYGEYIFSDSKICGGDLIFKGTRVLVKDVLYYVAQG
jgi:hypothetical protein